jgi:hypothetical protein
MVTPRHSKFELHPSERLISGIPADADAFAKALIAVSTDRVDYLVQAYVRDRTPSAFEQTPMLWGALRAWLTKRVNSQCQVSISPWEWGLNGSANLGFSASPDKFGTRFGAHSDLDFFVVNAELYDKVVREARLFSVSNFEAQRYRNARETVNRQLNRGLFLDTKQIPASEKFPINATLLNEVSIVVDKLHIESYPVERSFVRVYKNWNGLAHQLRLNILSLRKSLSAAHGVQ